MRADVQFAEPVHGGDAAASRPYRRDLDGGYAQPVALDHALSGEARLAVNDEADVEAGSTHVRADGVLHTEGCGETLHAHDTPDRSRRQTRDRPAP